MGRWSRAFTVACFAIAVPAVGLHSQTLTAGVGRFSESNTAAARDVAPNGSGALALEVLGGSIGSLVGIGIVGLTANCGVDDLGCVILSVGAGGALGAVGATIGTTIAARQTGSSRSVLGAALGSIVGTGVGLGVHYLLNRSSDRNLGDAVVVPILVISQGTFAALGSRLVGR